MKRVMPMMLILTIVMITCLFSSLTAQTKVEDIRSFTLKNGMKLILLEDHSIPNVAMYTFYKVGSRNEYPGITGLSHFFEHMMFNGAEKYGPKMFDRVMESAGGANNAYTTENITVYSNWFPSSALETIFDLEADRIGHLALSDKMVESERGVIISERVTRLANSNSSFLEEQVKAVAFMAHPYRWSVLGYESDIKNWKKSDLQLYFNTYYAPNNAVTVIVGDVTLEGIQKLAEKYLEPIPAHDPPRPIHTKEPEQLGEKRLYVHREVSSPNLMIVYHIPESTSKDYYALKMLDSILSDGNSSRLYNSLINEKQLAVEVYSMVENSIDPYLFSIYAVCSQGTDEMTLEKAILDEIDKISKEGVTEQELQKIKNNTLVKLYHSMETIDGKAEAIGTYEIFHGDYKKMFAAPEEVKKVSLEDIKHVASTYFKKSNRTIGILKSQEEK